MNGDHLYEADREEDEEHWVGHPEEVLHYRMAAREKLNAEDNVGCGREGGREGGWEGGREGEGREYLCCINAIFVESA